MTVNEGAIALALSAIICYLGTQIAAAFNVPDAGKLTCYPSRSIVTAMATTVCKAFCIKRDSDDILRVLLRTHHVVLSNRGDMPFFTWHYGIHILQRCTWKQVGGWEQLKSHMNFPISLLNLMSLGLLVHYEGGVSGLSFLIVMHNAGIPMITLLSVLLATLVPQQLQCLVESGEAIASILLAIFFAAVGKLPWMSSLQ